MIPALKMICILVQSLLHFPLCFSIAIGHDEGSLLTGGELIGSWYSGLLLTTSCMYSSTTSCTVKRYNNQLQLSFTSP